MSDEDKGHAEESYQDRLASISYVIHMTIDGEHHLHLAAFYSPSLASQCPCRRN